MAIQTFRLNTSADIHLIRNPVSESSLQLEVIGYHNNLSPTKEDITNQCIFAVVDPNIATVDINTGILAAIDDGITFLTVSFTDTVTSRTIELTARVWVHNQINQIFLGNNSGIVNEGSDNFQPTIYGEFDTGDIGDITGHPYTSFQANGTFVTIDIFGRVTGNSIGSTSIIVTDRINGSLAGNLPIEIAPPIDTSKEIVERVTFKGNGEDKRNILFLAEGFKQSGIFKIQKNRSSD